MGFRILSSLLEECIYLGLNLLLTEFFLFHLPIIILFLGFFFLSCNWKFNSERSISDPTEVVVPHPIVCTGLGSYRIALCIVIDVRRHPEMHLFRKQMQLSDRM